MQNHDDPSYTRPCTECQAGQMRRHYVTYFTWMGDELITVPDFPSWTCDLCGRREYDLQALNELTLLLNPVAGRPTPRSRTFPAQPSSKGSLPSRKE